MQGQTFKQHSALSKRPGTYLSAFCAIKNQQARNRDTRIRHCEIDVRLLPFHKNEHLNILEATQRIKGNGVRQQYAK